MRLANSKLRDLAWNRFTRTLLMPGKKPVTHDVKVCVTNKAYTEKFGRCKRRPGQFHFKENVQGFGATKHLIHDDFIRTGEKYGLK